jgi:hypothetical protein
MRPAAHDKDRLMRKKQRHAPRAKKARTLLAVVGGAVLSASIAVSAAGCGDEPVVVNPPDLSHPVDMRPLFDIGNPAVHD